MEQKELEKLKPGAKVRFTSEEAHRCNPSFYPVVGTVGELSGVGKGDGAWVKWDDGVKCKGVWHAAASWLERVSESTRPQKILITVDKADPKKVIAKDLDSGKTGVAKCNPTDTFDFYTGAKLAFARLCGEDKPKEEQKPKCKFKVGDKIVGNKLADRYVFTRNGWEGVVVEVFDNPERGSGCDDGKYWTFAASSVDGDARFDLSDDAFDLLPEPKGWNGKVVCVRTLADCFTVGKVYSVKDGVLLNDRLENAIGALITDPSVLNNPEIFTSKFIEYKGEA